MRPTTTLMMTTLCAAMLYSPALLACGNAMEGQELVANSARTLFASVSGVALVAAAALYFFRFRSRSDD